MNPDTLKPGILIDERARIRDEIMKLTFVGNTVLVDETTLVSLQDVLQIVSNSK